jgi:hypothetical protein
VENHFHLFLKTSKRNVKDWRPPYFVDKVPNPHQSKLLAKNLADCMEGVLGSSFVTKYSILDTLICMNKFKFPTVHNLWGTKLIDANKDFLIPKSFYDNIEWAMNENLTFLEIFKHSPFYRERKIKRENKKEIKRQKTEKLQINLSMKMNEETKETSSNYQDDQKYLNPASEAHLISEPLKNSSNETMQIETEDIIEGKNANLNRNEKPETSHQVKYNKISYKLY